MVVVLVEPRHPTHKSRLAVALPSSPAHDFELGPISSGIPPACWKPLPEDMAMFAVVSGELLLGRYLDDFGYLHVNLIDLPAD